MNIPYYQNILVKELCSVVNSSSGIEINIESHLIKKQEITRLQAVKNLFDIGLDINLSIQTEGLGKEKQITLLEYVTSNEIDFHILKICLEHVNKDYFGDLTYSNQCEIFGEILSKNIKIDEKNNLLDALFYKGFKFNQSDNYSKELEWIEYGYTDFVDSTIKNQPSFNWNHLYESSYNHKENVTIADKISTAIEDTLTSTDSKFKTNKLNNLYKTQEKVEKIKTFQSLENNLVEKSHSSKIKI